METLSRDRVIVLVDMDCFYVQVEQKLSSEYQNKPCAVVQYNTWKGGGIIAVNYEARAKGVTRMLRGDEAQKLCPDIHLFRVPEIRGKADLTRYREAGALVLDVLCEYSDCVERASIDEAYLDMTSIINSRMNNTPPIIADQLPNTFVVGWESEDPEARKVELQKWLQMIYEEEHLYHDRMLAVTAVIVEEMRTAVYEKTGYRCSAGVAHNKMLSKLSCGIHKPNKQTVLPQSSVQLLFSTMPVKKVRNLGGKCGEEIVKKFNTEMMGDLFHVPKSQLVSHFGEKTGHWLFNLAQGIENEPVTARQLPKSIGCGKNFPGKKSLSTKDEVVHWMKQLATELEERLIKDQDSNRRFARLLTISVRSNESSGFSTISRSCPIYLYNAEKLAHDAFLAINKLNTSSSDTLWRPTIWTLSMAASKFEDKLDNSHCNIESYFVNKKDMSSIDSNLSNEVAECESKTCNSNVLEASLNKSFKSTKNSVNSSKSIASFFTKKQIETQTVDNVEHTEVKQDEKSNEAEDLDSMLSICCTAIDSIQDGITDAIVNEESKSSSVVDESSKDCSLDEVAKTVYFAAIDTIQNDVTGPNINEDCKSSSDVESSKDCSLDKIYKPTVGFFAKKLAERSEFSFDIDFKHKSSDFLNLDKPVNKDDEKIISDTNSLLMPSTSASKDLDAVSTLNTYISNEDESLISNLDPELTKLCDKCNKLIPVWEDEEHFDYHLAVDLSAEFSKKSVTQQSSFLTKSSTSGKMPVVSKSKRNSKKRGSGSKSSSQSKKAYVQSNTLDAFLK